MMAAIYCDSVKLVLYVKLVGFHLLCDRPMDRIEPCLLKQLKCRRRQLISTVALSQSSSASVLDRPGVCGLSPLDAYCGFARQYCCLGSLVQQGLKRAAELRLITCCYLGASGYVRNCNNSGWCVV